ARTLNVSSCDSWSKLPCHVAFSPVGLSTVGSGIRSRYGTTAGLTRAPAGRNAPWRAATLGTGSTSVRPRCSRSPSNAPKKKVLFLTIGPPSDPPYWFRLKGGLSTSKKLVESSPELRQYSNTDPWMALLPDLVAML